MKYSWKQRRWRTAGAIEGDDAAGGRADGNREACAHATQAMDGWRPGRGRGNEGFHMLSLAAERAEAWCCGAGGYCAVAVVGLQRITVEKPTMSSRVVPESPGPEPVARLWALPVAATTATTAPTAPTATRPPRWHCTNWT
jgi:hypothetical protein